MFNSISNTLDILKYRVKWVDFAENAIQTPHGTIVASYWTGFIGLISIQEDSTQLQRRKKMFSR